MIMFPDATDLFCGDFLTQVPEESGEWDSGCEYGSYDPLGFVSGGFKASQLNWTVVDKEACAILSMCRRLSYLLWD